MMRLALRTAQALAVLMLLWPLQEATAYGEEKVDLNGTWQFRIDPSGNGQQMGWTRHMPDGTESVRVPHSWNIGKYDDYEGTAWYFRKFTYPHAGTAMHVELHFAATFYRARVWLNGRELGSHEGGYTEYFFDVTHDLKTVNYLAVQINNQPGVATIPGWAMKLHATGNVWYDWWHYGGIVRNVWLRVSSAALVRRQFIRPRIEGAAAQIADDVYLENHGSAAQAVTVTLRAWAPDGKLAATQSAHLTLAPGAARQQVSLRLENARLWHFDDPQVYRMEVDLAGENGDRLDSIADNFGVRSIEIRNRQLLLNGEPVRLTGMARHEESPWEGLAETAGTIKHDYDDMKNLQMTLTRPVHYPQNEQVLDYCDRHGILLIPEIPVWQFSESQMSDPRVIALARHMMTEMIEQDGNHPSIFAWSVCNESATDTTGGMAYFKTMRDMIKAIDPDRYVTYADDRIAFVDNPRTNSASLADFIMWNEYFGAWHGPTSLLPGVFERINRNYPDKMVVVSEFGTPGVFAPDSKSADRLRARIFSDQMPMFGKEPWIAGAIMWCYQDYKSHRNLWPGYTSGYVDHGVVDENRQRRPSYFVWQKLNSPAHLLVEWKYGADGTPIGFHARVARRAPDEIPSYTMRNYRLKWTLRDNDGARLAGKEVTLQTLGPPQDIVESFAGANTKSLTLHVVVYRPTGFVAAEKKALWWQPRTGGLSLDEMKREGMKTPE